MRFPVDKKATSKNDTHISDVFENALKKIEEYSYEELVNHIQKSRVNGYTGKPLFSEELENNGHISAQVFFESNDGIPDIRAIMTYSEPRFWSHIFPSTTSALIKPPQDQF